MALFVDTGAFLARSVGRDRHHQTARRAWDRLATLRERLVTSNFVIDETLTLLGRRAGYDFAAEEGRRLLSSRRLEILRPGAEDEVAALETFAKLADQAVSFTDCVSFVLMKQSRIRRAFTFDRHFVAAGFEIWPGNDL